MQNGNIKWFNPVKGYGFIVPETPPHNDVFFHISQLKRFGLSNIDDGHRVSFDTFSDRGRTAAQIFFIF